MAAYFTGWPCLINLAARRICSSKKDKFTFQPGWISKNLFLMAMLSLLAGSAAASDNMFQPIKSMVFEQH
jgi:hypothetical protein